MQLTVEQIEEFNTRGALIARGALAHADQQPLIDELSEWIDQRARTLDEQGKISDLRTFTITNLKKSADNSTKIQMELLEGFSKLQKIEREDALQFLKKIE